MLSVLTLGAPIDIFAPIENLLKPETPLAQLSGDEFDRRVDRAAEKCEQEPADDFCSCLIRESFPPMLPFQSPDQAHIKACQMVLSGVTPPPAESDAVAASAESDANRFVSFVFDEEGDHFDPAEDVRPLAKALRPYATTQVNSKSEIVPDSTIAFVLRTGISFPGANLALNNPIVTTGIGKKLGSESPSALLETAKAKHSGLQGLPSEVEDLLNGPALERLAAFFQDTWLSKLLTYEKGEYFFSCEQSAVLRHNHPELWELLQPHKGADYSVPLLEGANGFANDVGDSLRFQIDEQSGKLVPCDNVNLIPQQRLKLSYCMIEVAEFYHVALHIAAETMQFASQDFAPDGITPDPVWRLFNPGFNQTAQKSIAAEVLLTQSGRPDKKGQHGFLYSTTLPGEAVAELKATISELFSAPCSSDRWMPANVLDEHRQYFVPLLQRAQNVVCKDEYRLPIPPPIMTLYSAKLSSLGGYSPASIAPWMPPVTAAMIGIEHTMTFSWQLLFATDIEDGVADWQFRGPSKVANQVLTTIVLNIPNSTMHACNASATGPDSLPKTQTTSVQNEMAQNGLYLKHHGEGQYSSECKHFPAALKNMSNDLRALWKEVDDRNFSAVTFVYESSRCVTSSTWI